ncbi:MAG: RNA-directed DNA polymerase [Clostridiaceae bacterium]
MFKYENLLRNEYFPIELPPCFNTESLADNFQQIQQICSEINCRVPSEPMTFSGYKNSNGRRKFSVPNPYHYCKAVEAIVKNSDGIFDILNKNKVSLMCPQKHSPKKNESYNKRTSNISESQKIIEPLFQNNLFEIRLDIASCFDSIYTHSVAWAIHTKAVAKKNKTNELFGNVLDSCLQAMNYGQTNGILVGNAVSRIISEIILCKVDESVQKRLPNITYKRFVDDYLIYTKDGFEIKNIIAVFRQELSKYELALNENKIKVFESPFVFGKPWVEQMKEYIHLKPAVFLKKMIMEYNNYKDIAILKYGLKVIKFHKYSASEWKSVQSILINIWTKFPSLSNLLLPIFKQNENILNKSLVKNAIYSILETNLILQNDEEVIWAVWISKVFNISLAQPFIEKILSSKNWFAIIIMLDIIKCKNMKSKKIIKRSLNNLYNEIKEDYSDENGNLQNLMWTEVWLLAYETDKNKWLNVSNEKTFLFARKNLFFKKLQELNIGFYKPEYSYEVTHAVSKNSNYVTRTEFNDVMNKLQESINNRSYDSGKVDFKLTNEERDLVETIHSLVNTMDY